MTAPNAPYVYLPARAARVAAEEFKRRNDNPVRIDWGHAEMDDYLIPAIPGDLQCLLSRPGHAKTTTMIYLCKRHSKALPQGQLAVYATWETLIEEFMAVYNSERSGQSLESIGRGTANMGRLLDALAEGIGDNVAVVGRSMERDAKDQVTTPQVHTIDDLDACLAHLISAGFKIGCLYVDYLQRIPGRRGVDRSSQVTENLERLKDMSLKYTCRTFAGVQASRDVDDGAGLRIPEMDDGQWASAIEQTTDKLFGQTRPSLYLPDGQDIVTKGSGRSYKITLNMTVYQVLKQRWGPGGKVFFNSLDPVMCTLKPHSYTAMSSAQTGDLF